MKGFKKAFLCSLVFALCFLSFANADNEPQEEIVKLSVSADAHVCLEDSDIKGSEKLCFWMSLLENLEITLQKQKPHSSGSLLWIGEWSKEFIHNDVAFEATILVEHHKTPYENQVFEGYTIVGRVSQVLSSSDNTSSVRIHLNKLDDLDTTSLFGQTVNKDGFNIYPTLVIGPAFNLEPIQPILLKK